MNDSERTASRFLESLGLGLVEYEPDGKNPPDFLIAKRIAVEVPNRSNFETRRMKRPNELRQPTARR
jgi:hypothetical protein